MAAAQLTIDMLAKEPRWDDATLRALPGRSRGDLIGPWGKNVSARFGADAVARVKRRAAALSELPEVLTARDWLPVHLQLVLTEAIVDEFLAGDMRALLPLIIADTRAGMGRMHLAVVRALGPQRAFRLAPSAFRKVHERGTCEGEVSKSYARMTFNGTPLFMNPTWRILQLFAMESLLALLERSGSASGESDGTDRFVAVAEFRNI